jgi:hypothetical protein
MRRNELAAMRFVHLLIECEAVRLIARASTTKNHYEVRIRRQHFVRQLAIAVTISSIAQRSDTSAFCSLVQNVWRSEWKSARRPRPSFGEQSKGLDSLAVIMIDVERFDKLATPQEQMNYFMGASRARQLLAVFHKANRDPTEMAYLLGRTFPRCYRCDWSPSQDCPEGTAGHSPGFQPWEHGQ